MAVRAREAEQQGCLLRFLSFLFEVIRYKIIDLVFREKTPVGESTEVDCPGVSL